MGTRKVTKISVSVIPVLPERVSRKKVAAYARVSTASDDQLNSVEAQIDYYTRYIALHSDWDLVGIYADKGISGTSTIHREQFNQMIKDALAGKIDIIVAKSLSRFARNTVDTLQYIRKLKEIGVAVYFEKEDINTLEAKGEFLITLLSSMAQEESRSISENVTWGIRKRFTDGKYSVPYSSFLGYKKGKKGEMEIVPEEAKIVRYIYYLFLIGYSLFAIAHTLEQESIKSPGGKSKWFDTVVRSILTNEKYCGNALLQKKFVEDFLTKKVRKNRGQLPQYFVENGHPPIIDDAVWNRVQEIIGLRERHATFRNLGLKLKCGSCGMNYIRIVRSGSYNPPVVYYRCGNKYNRSTRCKNPIIYEFELKYLYECLFRRLLGKNKQIFSAVKETLNEVCSEEKRGIIAGYFKRAPIEEFAVPQEAIMILIEKAIILPNYTIAFTLIDKSCYKMMMQRWTPKSNKQKSIKE